MSLWTTSEIRLLTQRWNEGAVAKVISAELGTHSPEAVCKKANSLNLYKRRDHTNKSLVFRFFLDRREKTLLHKGAMRRGHSLSAYLRYLVLRDQ